MDADIEDLKQFGSKNGKIVAEKNPKLSAKKELKIKNSAKKKDLKTVVQSSKVVRVAKPLKKKKTVKFDLEK